MKTKKEIIEHFKNAEVVEIIRGNGKTLNMKGGEVVGYGDYVFHLKVNNKVLDNGIWNCIYDGIEFAKIIKYKKEKLYTLKEECKVYFEEGIRDKKNSFDRLKTYFPECIFYTSIERS